MVSRWINCISFCLLTIFQRAFETYDTVPFTTVIYKINKASFICIDRQGVFWSPRQFCIIVTHSDLCTWSISKNIRIAFLLLHRQIIRRGHLLLGAGTQQEGKCQEQRPITLQFHHFLYFLTLASLITPDQFIPKAKSYLLPQASRYGVIS